MEGSTASTAGVEGAGGTAGPGCGAHGRRGLASAHSTASTAGVEGAGGTGGHGRASRRGAERSEALASRAAGPSGARNTSGATQQHQRRHIRTIGHERGA